MHPKQETAFHRLHRVVAISMAYIKSGHLLPLPAVGAEADFSHIFRTLASLSVGRLPYCHSRCASRSAQFRGSDWNGLRVHGWCLEFRLRRGYSLLDCQPESRNDHHRQRCGIVSSRTTGTERADPGVIIAKGTTVTVSVTVRLPRGVNGAPAKNAMVTPVSDR